MDALLWHLSNAAVSSPQRISLIIAACTVMGCWGGGL